MTSSQLSKAIKEIQEICDRSDNRSQFFSYGTSGYKDSIRQYLDSSADNATVGVQPANVEDLSRIMKVLKKRMVPFAVKSGGHATNPSFSSTRGIQIYMSRFDRVRYYGDTETLDVEAGCLWDQVYAEAKKFKRNLVGGAANQGVGIAGYLLGGGYGHSTNQFGLGIDRITAFQVVVPDGDIINVAEDDTDHKDLFVALKGGRNNFGIVTRFTLKTHALGETYAPKFSFGSNHVMRVKAAILDFIEKEKRPEAAIETSFRHTLSNDGLQHTISVICYFNGKKPSDDPFQRFREIQSSAGPALAVEDEVIEALSEELEANAFRPYYLAPQTFEPGTNSPLKTVQERMSGIGEINAHGRFACIMVSKYTKNLIDEVDKQSAESSKSMKGHGGKLVAIGVWPFLPSIFDESPPAGWPHKKGKPFGPLLAYFLWDNKKEADTFWIKEMKRALAEIHTVALSEGCTTSDAPVYSNTTLEDTPVSEIYRENLDMLKKTRKIYDPTNVMGNTGGFKIPLP